MTQPADAEHPGVPLSASAENATNATNATNTTNAAKPETPKPAKKPKKPVKVAADTNPVARIAVDVPLPHLDRPFDYLVPARFADQAQPGTRVRVRFAGQLLDGFVLERLAESEHKGRLAFIDRVLSPEQVLTKEIAGLARAVADRYAGTFADVLRLAVPPRHATVEAEPAPAPAGLPRRPEPGGWRRYPAGEAFLNALADGRKARAAWQALPGPGWPHEIAIAAATTAAAGRGVVIVVPDARDLARVGEALTQAGVAHVGLTADLGPAERYRRWLAAKRGTVRVVAGTRAVMFAPVTQLGLVVLWDDGDDLHADPRAPYPNAREVLALRAHRAGAAALIGGFSRTPELTQLVASGWAHSLAPDRPELRAAAPLIRPAADDAQLDRDPGAVSARLPILALRTARAGLERGPVLIQVPRRGYLTAIACARCRAQARCPQCSGPLQITGEHEVPSCRWCGALAGGWTCPRCGNDRLRAIVTGAARTAEELGRAFPRVPIRTSGGNNVLADVPDRPALVIATPGAEPVPPAGYAAALLLDGWMQLGRPSLRAAEETLRRWLAAAALVTAGGQVLVHADSALPVVQAMIRWDPIAYSEREMADRAALCFPPVARMAAVSGSAETVGEFLDLAELPSGAEVLGPVPAEAGPVPPSAAEGDELVRALIRVGRENGLDLARALRAALAARSARKSPGAVRVQLDPIELM